MSKHDHLASDLARMAQLTSRRNVLRTLAGVSLLPIIGCASEALVGDGTPDGSTSGKDLAGGDGATPGTCSPIPEETGGPYPGDGSNGPNALTTSGIVRSDIRTSFAGLSGTAEGVPLTVRLTLVDTSGACAFLAGHAIYAWHCTRDGKYSLYTDANQNYLRGVQETDASGTVTFTTIFPGCYSGRWPHIHFEIFSSLAGATSASGKLRTSQLALPASACKDVYATSGYESSVSAFNGVSLSTDNVFSDGSSLQVPSVSGDPVSGYTATLLVGIAT